MQIGKLIRNTMMSGALMPSTTAVSQPVAGGFIDGKVSLFSDLPPSGQNTGKVYLVTQTSGIVFLTRKERGLYISNGSAWSLIGDWSAMLQDSNFTMWDDGDTTKRMRFELAGISSNVTRVMTIPDANVDLGDINVSKDTLAGITAQLMPRGSSCVYDENGRLSAVNSMAGSKYFVYVDGRLTQINGTGIFKSKSFIYDGDGRLQSISILS